LTVNLSLIPRYTFLIIGIITLFTLELSAQKKKGYFARRDSLKKARIAEGKPFLSLLAGPGYTPELGVVVAAGGLYSFKTNRKDSLIQRSTVNGSFGVTTTGALTGRAILTSFWKQDKIRIYANVNFKDMPDNYWGVGIEDGLNTPKSDSTTAYHRLWWQVNPRFLWQFTENWFIGPVLDFNFTEGSEESQGVLSDSTYQEFGPKNFNGGAGLVLQYDSRDIPVNAYHGTFVQVLSSIYGDYLGGDNLYYLLDIDIRNYHQLGKIDGQTFAWNIRTRFTTGDVPWGEMSQLGTPTDLRGYTWGRFRHQSMMYLLGEYRQMFRNRDTGERGKHGMVVWMGTGTIMKDVTTIENWLPNFGFGYRFEVQPRMNVRFDFGFGRDNAGLYFNFTEAF